MSIKCCVRKLPFVLLAVTIVYAGIIGTTSETSSPFNELLNPQGDINLATGDVAFADKLMTLKGRNGHDVDITLRYSSNVEKNARARNDKGAAGWVGLGWSLDYGYIQSDHKGTFSTEDDEWRYISTEGVSQKIVRGKVDDDGERKYYLEKNPYWLVEPQFADDKIAAWKLTDPSGMVYYYGETGEVLWQDHYSVLNTFAWRSVNDEDEVVGFVGEGTAEGAEAYPYQWHLTQIKDLWGNKMDFEYCQEVGLLETDGGPKEFSVGIYPSRIVNPYGDYIEFGIEDKNELEYGPGVLSATQMKGRDYPRIDMAGGISANQKQYQSKRSEPVNSFETLFGFSLGLLPSPFASRHTVC